MAPTVVLLVGIIPTALLLYGIVMTIWRSDFTQLQLAVRNCNILLVGTSLIVTVYLAVSSVGFGYWQYRWANPSMLVENKILTEPEWFEFLMSSLISISIIIGCVFYKAIIKRLFLIPMTEHQDWLLNIKERLLSLRMPTFKQKPKKIGDRGLRVVIDKPLPSEKVIEDIARWEKLRDEGRITEEEFEEIRIKVLQRI